MTVPSEFATEALSIDDAREAAYAALREANVRGLVGADAEAMRAAMVDVDARCEALRRAYFPDCHRLYVVIGMALTVSRGGQSREIVWERTKH